MENNYKQVKCASHCGKCGNECEKENNDKRPMTTTKAAINCWDDILQNDLLHHMNGKKKYEVDIIEGYILQQVKSKDDEITRLNARVKELEEALGLAKDGLESMTKKSYHGPFSNHNMQYDIKILLEKLKQTNHAQ